MVGALIAVGQGDLSKRDIYEMLTIPSKYSWCREIQPVPSSGLYLVDVEYPDNVLKDMTIQLEHEQSSYLNEDINELQAEIESKYSM